LTDGRLAGLLLLAFACAIAVILGIGPELVGLGLNLTMLGIAALTADERNREGGGWWTLLATGAVLSLAGEGISHLADTPGSIVALTGCLLVAAGAAIGFPVSD
jgi:hypothetical protein